MSNISSQITAIENAFEWMGIHHCSTILHFIFIDTFLGKAIFFLGIFFALARGLKVRHWTPVLTFLGMFFFLLFIVILPGNSLMVKPSLMEQASAPGPKTEDILKKFGIQQVTAAPAAVFFSQSCNTFTNGLVILMDRGRQQGLQSVDGPFLLGKLQHDMATVVEQGITSEALRQKTGAFLQDHYLPALSALEEKEKTEALEDCWPGAPGLVSLYSKQGHTDWKDLEDKIFLMADKTSIFSEGARRVYNGEDIKERVVRSVLSSDISKRQAFYSRLEDTGLHHGRRVEEFDAWIVSLVEWRPVLYGGFMWGLWVALPMVMVWMMLTGRLACGVAFLKYFLTAKTLPVFWAVADMVAAGMFHVLSGLKPGVMLWDMPQVNGMTAVGIIMAPVLWFGSVFILTRRSS